MVGPLNHTISVTSEVLLGGAFRLCDLWFQLAKLQEEQQKKEQRWTASMSRLRDRIEQLEQEKLELKQENQLLEQRRLEAWQAKKTTDTTTSAPPLLRTMVKLFYDLSDFDRPSPVNAVLSNHQLVPYEQS